MPSVTTLGSTESPSSGSNHSSSSNYSPRSASGSVRSPHDQPLDLGKSDIDDINSLLFSFGAPYESPSNSNIDWMSKEPIQWPSGVAGVDTPITSDFSYPSLHGQPPAYGSPDSNLNVPSQQSQHLPPIEHRHSVSGPVPTAQSNGSLYPSLSVLAEPKPVKPLPSSYRGHHHSHSSPGMPSPGMPNTHPAPQYGNGSGYGNQQQPQQHHGLPAVSFDYLAPQRSIPTPYITADHAREPILNPVQLLSRAPPVPASMRNILDDPVDVDSLHRVKQGTSSLRSTAEEARFDSPEEMSEDEMADSRPELHNVRSPSGSASASSFTSSSAYEDGDRITLPPIGTAPENRGAECHLPSLRSLLANAMSDLPGGGVEASPALSTVSSNASSSHKRSTPSRQFYPPLSALTSRFDEAEGRRPSTGEKLDRITRGVSSFRMNSMDDHPIVKEEEDIHAESSTWQQVASPLSADDDGHDYKSESDDDMGPDAVYKRSRLRTRSPSPVASDVDELESDTDDYATEPYTPSSGHRPKMQRKSTSTEKRASPPVLSAAEKAQAAIRHRRFAVIQALVLRANQLYRENLAKKMAKGLPALVRVKEEEME